jgi:hypothetical protein
MSWGECDTVACVGVGAVDVEPMLLCGKRQAEMTLRMGTLRMGRCRGCCG